MKKFIAVFTLIAMIISYSIMGTNAKTAYNYGDVDRDNIVSIMDATSIQLNLASLLQFDNVSKKLADVDADGYLSIVDATTIQLYLASYIDQFPANETQTPTQPDLDDDGYNNQVVKP